MMRRIGLSVTVLLLAAGCAAPGTDGRFVQPHTVSEPLRTGQSAGTLTLGSGAPEITIRDADLGDRLYEATTPVGAPRGGPTALRLDGGSGPLTVRLSRKVAWDLRVAGGATTETIDLRGTRVTALTITGGVGRLEIRLPVPAATTTVRIGGGASDLQLYVPATVPVRVAADAGAGTVTLDGVTHVGIPAGEQFGEPARQSYDVQLVAGVGAVRLDHI